MKIIAILFVILLVTKIDAQNINPFVGAGPVVYWQSDVTVTGSPVSAWVSSPAARFSVVQGTGANQPAVTAAVFGSTAGIVFDGSNDILSLTGKPVQAKFSGSLSTVFKTPTTVSGPVVIVSQSDSAVTNDWWEIGITAAGKLYIESNVAGTKHTVEGSTILAASTIYEALFTYDGTDYSILLNGVEENPLVITNIGAFAWAGRVTGTTVFSIGGTVTSSGATRLFNGSIGAIYFWDYDITR